MLLPPDLRHWVPQDDMVHFAIQVVEGMSFSTLRINLCGSGSKQYPPKMMLALLVYCYDNDISSRRIERPTYRDIAVPLTQIAEIVRRQLSSARNRTDVPLRSEAGGP
jgi:transposase